MVRRSHSKARPPRPAAEPCVREHACACAFVCACDARTHAPHNHALTQWRLLSPQAIDAFISSAYAPHPNRKQRSRAQRRTHRSSTHGRTPLRQ
jgi:hypothetical protein